MMVVWSGESRTSDAQREPNPDIHSFVSRHTGSEGFKQLFREGMALVETAATYLDGPGRQESKALPRHIALAYATESMRLTTRLMQMASWLLLRRAIAEGELTPQQAQSDKHRVRLTRQDISCNRETYDRLPAEFVSLCEKSLRMQERIIHLDASPQIAGAPAFGQAAHPVAEHWARLRDAFSAGRGPRFSR